MVGGVLRVLGRPRTSLTRESTRGESRKRRFRVGVIATSDKSPANLSLHHVEVEAAVDGGAVLFEEFFALGFVVGEFGFEVWGEGGFDGAGGGAGAEDDAGAGLADAVDLAPEGGDLVGGHPVLGVEHDEAVEGAGGEGGEEAGHAGEVGVDAVDVGFEGGEVLGLEVAGDGEAVLGVVPAAEGLPGEVVGLDGELAGEAFDAEAVFLEDGAIGGFVFEGFVLAGGDAQAVEEEGELGHAFDDGHFEEGLDFLGEHGFLLGHGGAFEEA